MGAIVGFRDIRNSANNINVKVSVRVTILVLAVGLASCASMSPSECRFADWQEVGRTDAQRGFAQDYLARHRKSCAKAGFPVDVTRYYAGYQRGLKDYCIAPTAFNAARQGRDRPVQCSDISVQANDYLRAYDYGLKVRDKEVEISSLQQSMEDIVNAVADAEAHLQAIMSTLDHEQLDNYEAIALHEESKQIGHQVKRDLEKYDILVEELEAALNQRDEMIRAFQTDRY